MARTSGSTSAELHVEPFTLGPFATNCYVLFVEGETECWIIDASFDPQPMVNFIRAQHLEPSRILLTHAHIDHIAGLTEMKRAFPRAKVAIHADEATWLTDPVANMSVLHGIAVTPGAPDEMLQHDQALALSGRAWRVIHTPGHSPGGVCFFSEADRLAIVGDALFAGSIGRTDFPASDHDTLINSIRQRLYTLPEDTTILPGHGPPSTIAREKRGNPFVRG